MLTARPLPFPARSRVLPGILLSLLLALLLGPASATHRVDQRFTVWGLVTDADGEPVADQRVDIIVADGFRMQRVRTDAEGWYRKVLAVTDADRGKVFDVRVDGQRVQVQVDFDPQDHETERGQRVDFELAPQ